MGKNRRIVIDFFRKSGMMPLVSRISNARYYLLKRRFASKGLNPLDAVYDDNFFEEINLVDKKTNSSKIVAEYITREFSPKSAIDVGCGTGVYLKKLQDLGVNVLGIDGSRKALKYTELAPQKILIKDVTKPFFLGMKFDIVLCFEVAEHILPKYSKILVKNLTIHGDIILFTAAPPNQGGTDHINEKPKEYWIKLFREEGFIYDAKVTEKMKEFLKGKKCIWWIPKNIFVFRKQPSDRTPASSCI
ncbi:MAG: class I SAM-dependent methyltransferase [Candidatus Aenigmarchaeota archaeon]|nr:class I SAM-dependent methyltransferase [Candidatus Aenigmarchaeota archaeon]